MTAIALVFGVSLLLSVLVIAWDTWDTIRHPEEARKDPRGAPPLNLRRPRDLLPSLSSWSA